MHGLAPEEIADALAKFRAQPAWLSWSATPTVATRDFAKGQLVAVQLAYVVAVLAIFISELAQGIAERLLLWVWLAESFGNLAIRVGLFARMMKAWHPADLAGSPYLRLVPLISNVIVGVHWVWTVHLFARPTFDPTIVVLIVTFVLLSVAAVSISAASPVTALAYPAFLWVPLGLAIAQTNWAGAYVVPLLIAAVAFTVGLTFFMVTTHVRRYLTKSDEAELLLARLQRSNEQLSDSNAELQALRRQAQAELEARSEYFTAASHDLKQRLHALKLMTAVKPLAAVESVKQAQPLEGFRMAVEELQAFLTDILEFARCEHVAQDLQLAPVCLQQVFQQLNVQFEDVADARRVELRFRTTSFQLITDRVMLTRILENLISNAIKYSPPGRRVLVAARRRCNALSIEVWDQGAGIPADAQQAVFRPFYQLLYYSRRIEGVGLGLAIVERLTNALGYAVAVRSVEGRGTLMRIVVPVK